MMVSALREKCWNSSEFHLSIIVCFAAQQVSFNLESFPARIAVNQTIRPIIIRPYWQSDASNFWMLAPPPLRICRNGFKLL